MILPIVDCDTVIDALEFVYPYVWRYECEAVTLMKSNPYKQINSILVHRDAMLWMEYHEEETWSGVEDDDLRDDNGFIVTQFTCRINQDEYISSTVLGYYGAKLDYEHYDY